MLTLNNFKTAFYSLTKAKAYVVTIVLTLGITLGALVAMFNLNYQLLAAPLPYPDADRLVVFKSQQFDEGKPIEIRASPYPLVIETYKQKDEYFSQKAIVSYTNSIERRWPDSPVLTTISTTPDFFNMIDAPMVKGRRFSASEDLDSMTPVAVISYDAWNKYFQLDPDVIGKTLNIMEIDFKIIGVLDEHFIEPELIHRGWRTDVWLPMDYDDVPLTARKNWQTSVGRTFVVGKLNNNINLPLAEHNVGQQAAKRFQDELQVLNDNPDRKLDIKLVRFSDVILGDSYKQSLLIFISVLVLLLIASANVVNLILARATHQQRSMAIQLALGAQNKHLFNAVFAELIWLMLATGLLSIGIASAILILISSAAHGLLPRLHELHINPITFVFALVISFLLAILFSLIVSRQINMRRLQGLLQTSGKGVGLQISKRVRHLLIFVQIALTSILLTASLHIFFHAVQQLTQNVGYHTSNQYQVRLSVATLWGSTTREERAAYFDAIVEQLHQDPKVESAGLSSGMPVSISGPRFRNLVLEPGAENKMVMIETWCNGNFLTILDMPLIAGRYFTNEEARANDNKLVINETLARLIDPQANVLGKMVYRDGESAALEIVGVVHDLNIPAGQKMAREEPRAFRSNIYEESEIVIRVKSGQILSPADVNAHAAKVHPELKVFYMETTKGALATFTHSQKTMAGLTAGLSLLALTLAAIGIYGILTYTVQLRRFELGVRMAIGARPVSIFLQIYKDNFIPVTTGLLMSLMVLIGLWLWIKQTPFYLSSSFLGWLLPVVLILSIAVIASFLSLRTIVRKPANSVLRGE